MRSNSIQNSFCRPPRYNPFFPVCRMSMDPAFSDKIADLYRRMDAAWEETAAHYGFQCNGCEDNCCRSFFYHHTHIETDYLVAGLATLPADLFQKITATLDKEMKAAGTSGDSGRMCPLNIDGLCVLYERRPMICRLHGIPHEFHKPDGEIVKGPGCATGSPLFSSSGHFRLNRTPFYREMARLEAAYRKAAGKSGKIKRTVTQMLVTAPGQDMSC